MQIQSRNGSYEKLEKCAKVLRTDTFGLERLLAIELLNLLWVEYSSLSLTAFSTSIYYTEQYLLFMVDRWLHYGGHNIWGNGPC